jgi:chromosome segregation ATPase
MTYIPEGQTACVCEVKGGGVSIETWNAHEEAHREHHEEALTCAECCRTSLKLRHAREDLADIREELVVAREELVDARECLAGARGEIEFLEDAREEIGNTRDWLQGARAEFARTFTEDLVSIREENDRLRQLLMSIRKCMRDGEELFLTV